MRVAIQRELPPDIETVVCGYRNPVPPDVDAVILGGGTLIGCALPTLSQFYAKNDSPLMILGCGYRHYNAKKEWDKYWEHASHIAVRGEYTIKKLDDNHKDIDKIDCIGDPIFLYEDEHYKKLPYLGVAMREIKREIIEKYIPDLESATGLTHKKIGFSKNQRDICDKFLTLEETYEAVCSSSWWWGNRLHSFALALINRIPAIALDIEYRKVHDLCTTINYPYYVTTEENPMELYDDLMDNWGNQIEETQSQIANIRGNLKNLIGDFITYAT